MLLTCWNGTDANNLQPGGGLKPREPSDRNAVAWNVLLLSAGKTHTMLGDLGDGSRAGLAPRIFARLFERIAEVEQGQVWSPHMPARQMKRATCITYAAAVGA